MLVVADTGPLIALDAAGCLHVLPLLYGEIHVPVAVADELAAGSESAGAGAAAQPWLIIEAVESSDPVLRRLSVILDRGEASALALASRVNAGLVLADDRAARREAERMGLSVRGALGVLVDAKRAGHVAAVRPLVARMQGYGIWLSDELVRAVLESVGETDRAGGS